MLVWRKAKSEEPKGTMGEQYCHRQKAIDTVPAQRNFYSPPFGSSLFAFRYIIALCLSLIAFYSCETDISQVKQMTNHADAAEENGKEIEIVYSDSGKVKARIIAPALIKKNKEEGVTEFPQGLRLYIYNDSMKLESKLSANYGIANDTKEELLVRDNVVVVSIEGKKLNSEELIWRRKAKKIFSDKFVKITTKDEIIYGKGFESDEDFGNYMIRQVTGTIVKETKGFDADL